MLLLHLSIDLSACRFIDLRDRRSVSLLLCCSVRLVVNSSVCCRSVVCRCVDLFVDRWIDLSLCRSVSLWLCWSVDLSVWRSVGLSVCRFVSLLVCRVYLSVSVMFCVWLCQQAGPFYFPSVSAFFVLLCFGCRCFLEYCSALRVSPAETRLTVYRRLDME